MDKQKLVKLQELANNLAAKVGTPLVIRVGAYSKGDEVYLSEADLKRYQEFKDPTRQVEFACGRRLAHQCVTELAQHENFSISTKDGIPKCSLADIHLSISHKRGVAVAAACRHYIGVDLEYLRQVKYKSLSARLFSVAERDLLASIPIDVEKKFFAAFSAKEALFKSISIHTAGVRTLSSFEFSDFLIAEDSCKYSAINGGVSYKGVGGIQGKWFLSIALPAELPGNL